MGLSRAGIEWVVCAPTAHAITASPFHNSTTLAGDIALDWCSVRPISHIIGSASLREVAHSFSATAEERKDENRWSHEEKKEERDAYAGTRVLANLEVPELERVLVRLNEREQQEDTERAVRRERPAMDLIHLRDEA